MIYHPTAKGASSFTSIAADEQGPVSEAEQGPEPRLDYSDHITRLSSNLAAMARGERLDENHNIEEEEEDLTENALNRLTTEVRPEKSNIVINSDSDTCFSSDDTIPPKKETQTLFNPQGNNNNLLGMKKSSSTTMVDTAVSRLKASIKRRKINCCPKRGLSMSSSIPEKARHTTYDRVAWRIAHAEEGSYLPEY